jgi:hypothetical protein
VNKGGKRYTGLSDKMLGHAEYQKRWRALHGTKVGQFGRPSKTGLSRKTLGHAGYMREFRKLKQKL